MEIGAKINEVLESIDWEAIQTKAEEIATKEITGNLIVEELLLAKSKYANSIAYAVMGYDNSHYYTLFWYQDSQLVFFVDDQNIGNVSDKRLKTDFAEIDDKFLDAIEELEIQQFKIDNRNGLISFGIIAQDLIEVFEKYEINPDDYEILGKIKYRLDDDTEYYKIEYIQFLVLKQKATRANILQDTTEIIEQMQTDISNIWEVIYPVGAVYISTVETSPETLFGGTWKEINDVFLLSAGSTYTAGNTGGASTVTLTTSNLPAHTHSITNYPYASGDEAEGYGAEVGGTGYTDRLMIEGTTTKTTTSTGSGTAHNNMPPYLVVYMWKRTE